MNSERFICAFHASPLWLSPPRLTRSDYEETAAAKGLDVAWYCRKFRKTQKDFFGVGDCVSDYLRNAGPCRRSPNLGFDEFWYRHEYTDVEELVKAGKYSSGWEHYLEEGARKGYNPVFWFDERWYRKQYGEVRTAIEQRELICGFEHYLLYGIRGDLSPSIYFNVPWYRKQYLPETTGPRQHPLTHYLLSSPIPETPTPFFHSRWYLEWYFPQAAEETEPPLPAFEHYMLFGRRAGYSPSPYFNEMAYRETYPEVLAKIQAGLYSSGFEHYVSEGPANGFLPRTHLDHAGIDYSSPSFIANYERSLILHLSQLQQICSLAES